MQYHLRTLGHLSLRPGTPGSDPVLRDSKSLAVLAYVATAPGRKARRSHLADLLWPSSDSTRARRSLRQALYYLSQKADDGLVLSDDGVLGVDPGRLTVDLWRFDQALEDGDWERATELYDGPFLGGFDVEGGREFEGWLEAQNERVWSGLKAAYFRLIREAVEADDVRRAVRHARDYVELNPLDEKAQRTLVRTHLAAGDRVGAYRAYERYRTLLREELGEEPGPELEARVGELRDRLFAAPGDVPGDEAVGGREQEGEDERGDEGRTAESAPSARVPSGEAEPPTAEGGRSTPPLVRAGLVARWLGVGVAAGLALGFALWWLALGRGGGAPGDHTWAGATGRLAAHVEGGRELVLALRDGRVERSVVRRARPRETRAPGRERSLHRISTPGGADVVMVEASGDSTPVATSGADEGALAWGPEGRRALLWRGRPTGDGRGYVRDLLLLDGRTGRIRALDVPNLGTPPQAAWSPLGPHVAFRAEADSGRGDLFRVDVDGTDLIRLTRNPAEDRDPAWSPGGRRLAFVSSRAGGRHLYVTDARGQDVERITFGPAEDRCPVWLSPSHLAFLSDRGSGTGVWLMDVQTRNLRRLTRREGLRGLRALEVPARREPLGDVRVGALPAVASPGEHLSLRAELLDAGGRPVSAELASLTWSTSDPSVLRLDGDGEGRVVGAGRARVVASAGGWVSDTVRIASRPLVARASRTLLAEDWAVGLDATRWVVFGEPAPFVSERRTAPDSVRADPVRDRSGADAPEGPPPSRVFVSNGDANYASGAVARRRLSLEEGLSVAFEARLPFTEHMYQMLAVGLARGVPEAGAPRWAGRGRGLELVLGGEDRSAFHLHDTEGGTHRIPRVPDPGSWHRYTLQVDRNGRVALVVDGRMWWRSTGPVASALEDDEVHLSLAGRSMHTRLAVGRVRVWEGLRWVTGQRPGKLAREAGTAGG